MLREAFAVAVVALAGNAFAGFVIDGHEPGAWSSDEATLRANLGITDAYRIESFEAGGITMPGLFVTDAGETFPNNPVKIDDDPNDADERWHGLWSVQNTNPFTGDGDIDVLFTLPAGITRFGVGLGHHRELTEVIVNGNVNLGDVRSFPGFDNGDFKRNGYIWITATDGDVIETVLFDNLDDSDAVFFDYVAVLPSPGAGLLLGVGGLVVMRRR